MSVAETCSSRECLRPLPATLRPLPLTHNWTAFPSVPWVRGLPVRELRPVEYDQNGCGPLWGLACKNCPRLSSTSFPWLNTENSKRPKKGAVTWSQDGVPWMTVWGNYPHCSLPPSDPQWVEIRVRNMLLLHWAIQMWGTVCLPVSITSTMTLKGFLESGIPWIFLCFIDF